MAYMLRRLAFIVLAVAFLVVFGERKSGATEWGVSGPVAETKHQRLHRLQISHKHKPRPQVRAYVRREPVIREPDAQCHPEVRVVGSQNVSEAQAEDSAKRAMLEEIRWKYGEAAMTIENGKNYKRRCSRSSIGELAGQTFHRCEVSMIPCRPIMEDGK